MKLVMFFFALGVCYVSLPVSSHVVAVSSASTVGPAAALFAAAADADSNDAKGDSATKSDEKPAAKPADKKKDAESDAKAASDNDKDQKKAKRQTAKAKAERIKKVATLDGVFTAEKMTPVELRPEEWSQFEIVEIVDHGSTVHAGETLVKFDSEKFDKELGDLELQLHLSELTIRKAEEELPRREKLLKMAAEDAERNDKDTREDYDRYLAIDRPLLLKSVEYSLKSAKFSLEYYQDELDQLEKMYEADDLTEETEEIVLKRSRTQVDFAKFSLERATIRADELLNIQLPRMDIAAKESVDKAGISLAQARTALAIDANRARYELEQQRENRAKSLDRHAKLLADKGLLELKASTDGIVYYGECEDGKWSDMASLIGKLKPHQKAPTDTVLMTIVERRPLEVRRRSASRNERR